MTSIVETIPAADWDPHNATTLEPLRRKWKTVPNADGRVTTTVLRQISDDELLAYWRKQVEQSTTGDSFSIRGWYHQLYKPILKNKKVLDVGAGLGIDALTFALHRADVTLLDIVPENVENTSRLINALGIKKHARSFWMEDLSSLAKLPNDFDVMWCQGSLINAPFDFVREEIQTLLTHLPVGGRWIELAYPKERWVREGSFPFEEWGEKTDGEGTPWVEWYDLEKLTRALTPAEFDTVISFNFRDDEFNWFDLVRRS